MSARDRVIIALSKELLGPRGGAFEQITVDPKGEYLVGVLEPKDYVRGAFAFYGRSDFQTLEAGIGEDDDVAEEMEPAELGLQLDPRALPKSMGISFVIDGNGVPLIGLCATWARYIGNRQKGWQRKPCKFVRRNIDVRNDNLLFKGEGIRISLRTTKTQQGHHHVSIYFINETPLSNEQYPRTEDHIFQPQLRIVCERGAAIVPIIGELGEEEEEASLSLLYRNHAAMARGHLCGATWKEVDPERPWHKTKDYEKRPKAHPFIWVDAEIVEESERSIFTNPDVRTEYLPCYPVQQITMRPQQEARILKEFEASALAEAWNTDTLASFLDPIIEAYGRWIKRQRETLQALPQQYRQTAERHLALCEESKHRIKEGIDFLKNNDDARLAFCFMNKVMHQQSIWKTGEPLVWRLFQISFILQCIPSIVKDEHPHRLVCDLLWFPTAAGKTEAYLGLSMFTLAFRRRRGRQKEAGGGGTGVLSRYTLRMLTIQQFRRALIAITACDYLRVKDWRPTGYPEEERNLWGTARFSIGLWVGQEVTPNRLVDHKGFDIFLHREVRYPGAVSILRGLSIYAGTGFRVKKLTENEPAQILNCPVCGSILAVPTEPSLPQGKHIIHFLVSSQITPNPKKTSMEGLGFKVSDCKVTSLPSPRYYAVSITFSSDHKVGSDSIDRWWQNYVLQALGPSSKGEFARASRPGYFIRRGGGVQNEAIDFEIHCPNPQCELSSVQWFELVPGPSGKKQFSYILPPFRIPQKKGFSHGVPISAYVVDDQVYHRCPSLIIATVDKFARLSYEPKAAAMFGNVTRFDTSWGYYRDEAPPDRGDMQEGEIYDVPRFEPPELIIQDELHLIEGPLGSMVGIYEIALDILSSKQKGNTPIRPKYVASSATIRHATSQVSAVFDRKLAVFPPLGLSIDDNFFSYTQEGHPLDSKPAGRLYVGVCAPGHGPHTPTIRIWTALLRETYEMRLSMGSNDREVDQFWTTVGYFNAIRELAAALGLFRADIRERLRQTSASVRPLELYLELSSRMKSSEIPMALEQLSKFPDNEVDAVFSTSMFGTGVDVDRLGLMVVHGQPKTTANYIQATGRVGRMKGGLVITFLRATRPRDLDHYEFFVGYHRCLSRYVEPITVHPFSPRARERALGPVAVALLRNADTISNISVGKEWAAEDLYTKAAGVVANSGCRRMATHRNSPEVLALTDIIEKRAQNQPDGCRPPPIIVKDEIASEMDRWGSASKGLPKLIYYEPTMIRDPQNPVVLGDLQHEKRGLPVVFKNSPQSLREVESTATFGG
jgi:hypothetical protein